MGLLLRPRIALVSSCSALINFLKKYYNIKRQKEYIDRFFYVLGEQQNTYNMPCCQQKKEEAETHDNGLPQPLHMNCTVITINSIGDENWKESSIFFFRIILVSVDINFLHLIDNNSLILPVQKFVTKKANSFTFG